MKTHFTVIKIRKIVTMSIVLMTNLFLFGIENDLNTKALALLNEGDELLSRNLFSEAEAKLIESISVWEMTGEVQGSSVYSYLRLALLYRKTGDYTKSIENYNTAESILLKDPRENQPMLGALYTTYGNLYLHLGDNNKANFYFEKAITILKPVQKDYSGLYYDALYKQLEAFYYRKFFNKTIQHIDHLKLRQDDVATSKFFRLKSNCLINIGKADDAILILQSLLKASSVDRVKHIETNLLLAKANLSLKKHYDTNLALQRAKELLQTDRAENDPWLVYYWELQGRYYWLLGDIATVNEEKLILYSKSIDAFDKALKLNSQEGNNTIPYLDMPGGDFVNPSQVSDLLKSRAQLLVQTFEVNSVLDRTTAISYLDGALSTYRALILFLHDFRISLLDEDSRIELSEHQAEVYQNAFNTAYRLLLLTGNEKYKEQLFFLSESSKSASMLTSINNVNAKNFGGVPDSLLVVEQTYRTQIASYKLMIFNQRNSIAPDTTLLNHWSNHLFELEKKRDNLLYHFEKNFPEYYKLKYQSNIIQTREVQNRLKNRQAILSYFIIEPESESDSGAVYCLFLTRHNFDVHKYSIGNEYNRSLDEMIHLLSDGNVAETGMKEFCAYVDAANNLYNCLVSKPLSGYYIEECIVVPDDKLVYLPFDALLATKPITNRVDYRNLDYLVHHYSFSYAYSATLYLEYLQKKTRNRNNILAFAPKYENKLANSHLTLNETFPLNRYVPLPGAEEEVEFLSRQYKALKYIGEEALASNFVAMAHDYDILHLAMHTQINDSLPMFSKLLFSSVSESDDNGYLNTQEIYNMNLDARMAVLSGCNTGAGKFLKGEGVASLARAFMYAGCPSIVMTLWTANDKSSAFLMKDFYSNLFKGENKSAALRKAKCAYLKTADPLKAHPHFWLGYIVVGDPQSIAYDNSILWYTGGFFAVIVFVIGWYFARKSKRKIG
jgi:CHAT domain-containing protein